MQPGGEKLETDKLQGGEDKLLSFVPVRIPQILFINNFHNLKNMLLLIRNLLGTCRPEFFGYYSCLQVLVFGAFLQHATATSALHSESTAINLFSIVIVGLGLFTTL